MFKKTIFVIVFAGLATASFAQKKPKNQAFIVTGKVLNTSDSLLTKKLYFDGLQQKIVQNYTLAADFFNRVIELDPANDAAMYELANINFAEGQDKETERLARNAVTVEPENKWYWLLLAEVYKKNNNLEQLVLVFDELIRISPDDPDFLFDKASALIRENKVNEAALVYNQIEKKFGASDDLSAARQRIFVKQGKPEKAAEELEKQIAENPNEIRNYLYLSEIYAKSGGREKSMAILQKAKAIDPANALVRLSLADNYRAQKRFDDSFTELKVAFEDANLNIDEKVRIVVSFFPLFADAKARAQADELAYLTTKSHPEDPKAYAVYGDVLFQEQKFADAKKAYRQALKLNDQVYLIWEQLLRIQISESQFTEAITDGETALTIFPNQAPLYLYTAIAFAQTGKHEKAISYLKNAASLEAENKEIIVQIHSGLGDSYNALKRYRESDQAYDKALAADKDNTYTLNNYAYYLSLRGENLDKAEQMSKRSNELEPGNASFQDTYAWILFQKKNYKDARVWIEKAVNGDKSKSGVQIEHYGDILFHLNEKQKAVEQWKTAKAAGVKSEKLERKINEKKYIQ